MGIDAHPMVNHWDSLVPRKPGNEATTMRVYWNLIKKPEQPSEENGC